MDSCLRKSDDQHPAPPWPANADEPNYENWRAVRRSVRRTLAPVRVQEAAVVRRRVGKSVSRYWPS